MTDSFTSAGLVAGLPESGASTRGLLGSLVDNFLVCVVGEVLADDSHVALIAEALRIESTCS